MSHGRSRIFASDGIAIDCDFSIEIRVLLIEAILNEPAHEIMVHVLIT